MVVFSRRNLIATLASALAVSVVFVPAFGQQASVTTAASKEVFKLPPLPYAYDALEPVIDAQTMAFHHDKHHAAYVNNLNEAAQVAPQIGERPVDYVLTHLSDLPESVRGKVRNNLGGHVNHSMFWEIMGKNGGAPSGALLDAINRDFGGLEKLKEEFNGAGLRVFGSGWVFVVVSREGKLTIETRPNQDSPLMDGKRALFGNDVWEHAYYLKYQNRRTEYLKAWWGVLNWQKIAERYAMAKNGALLI